MCVEKQYMERALQLAKAGEGRVAPNPMVGAVIVARDRIIGEGFHGVYGGPHAEVNAINSVREKDRELLKEATLYVNLEPCAHFGKTPPCANLIVTTGIPRVVIASPDPNPLVAGKGVEILKRAGIKVTEGVLREEADRLNKRFLTFQLNHRPWILLKWAQSSDGFMASIDNEGNSRPVRFSNTLSSVWMHRERARNSAILVGSNTKRIDCPRLNLRYWEGKDPVIIDCDHSMNLDALMERLYEDKISSLTVEGGPKLLKSFIEASLYDTIRIEIASFRLFKGLKAPDLPSDIFLLSSEKVRANTILTYESFSSI